MHALIAAMGGDSCGRHPAGPVLYSAERRSDLAPRVGGQRARLRDAMGVQLCGRARTRLRVRSDRSSTHCGARHPAGEPGNDDLGSLSSWYVWAALGLYPETPGAPMLVAIGSPLFPLRLWRLPSGHQLIVDGPAPPPAPLRPEPADQRQADQQTWLSTGDLLERSDTTLDFTLGSQPNQSWGSMPRERTAIVLGRSEHRSSRLSIENSVTVAPGGSTTVNLSAQNVTDSPGHCNIAASAPGGVSVVPASGVVLSAGRWPGKRGSVTVSAGSNTAENNYHVPIALSVAAQSQPVQQLSVIVASPGSLLSAFNNIGISSDASQWAADMDGFGYSYSSQGLSSGGIDAGHDDRRTDVAGRSVPHDPDNVACRGADKSSSGVPGATASPSSANCNQWPEHRNRHISPTPMEAPRQQTIGPLRLDAERGNEQRQLRQSDRRDHAISQLDRIRYRDGIHPSAQRECDATYVFLATVPLNSAQDPGLGDPAKQREPGPVPRLRLWAPLLRPRSLASAPPALSPGRS